MKRTTIFLSLVVVLIIAWIAFYLFKKKAVIQVGPSVPTSCPATAAIKCPAPSDLDANGCPKDPIMGGFDQSTKVCTVTLKFYQTYGGCKDDQIPMTFYAHPTRPGQASKYRIVSASALDIQAAFTWIDCKDHGKMLGPVNLGKPFGFNPNDDFSQFKPEHTSEDADPAMKGRCFKVTVNPSPPENCVDPHIIIGD